MNPIQIHHPYDWKKLKRNLSGSVGFVPTLGALHKGHGALIKKSLSENDFTLVCIFLNPTQFNCKEDLNKYPSDLLKDLNFLKKMDVPYVFLPRYEDLYPDDYKFKITEDHFSHKLCGQSRPGHFDGVLTVVLKLLNIIQPNRAYFGEKDFQQLSLIKEMSAAFFLDVEIVSVPTVREEDGLAMSSRNLRLALDHRKQAPLFYKILQTAFSTEDAKNELKTHGFKIDYITDIDHRRYGAVYLGNIRLIDNVEV